MKQWLYRYTIVIEQVELEYSTHLEFTFDKEHIATFSEPQSKAQLDNYIQNLDIDLKADTEDVYSGGYKITEYTVDMVKIPAPEVYLVKNGQYYLMIELVKERDSNGKTKMVEHLMLTTEVEKASKFGSISTASSYSRRIGRNNRRSQVVKHKGGLKHDFKIFKD